MVGIAERDGRIHLQTVKSTKNHHVRPVIREKVNPDTETIVTDGAGRYKTLIPKEKHQQGNHKRELHNKNWTTTQTVENAFSLFKRGLLGTTTN